MKTLIYIVGISISLLGFAAGNLIALIIFWYYGKEDIREYLNDNKKC